MWFELLDRGDPRRRRARRRGRAAAPRRLRRGGRAGRRARGAGGALGRRRARGACISSTWTARARAAFGPSSCASVVRAAALGARAGVGRDPLARRRARAARRGRRPRRRRHGGVARTRRRGCELGDALVVALDVARRPGAKRQAGPRRPASRSPRRSTRAPGARVLVTAIDRDGTLAGPDLELVARRRSGRACACSPRAGSARRATWRLWRGRRRSRRRRPCAPYGVAQLSPPSTTSRWPLT